jgi:predicted transcriptional regulator
VQEVPVERIDIAIPHCIATTILHEIAKNPGVWEGKLAQNLGLSQQIVHYHLKRLAGAKLIASEMEGRRKLYHLCGATRTEVHS